MLGTGSPRVSRQGCGPVKPAVFMATDNRLSSGPPPPYREHSGVITLSLVQWVLVVLALLLGWWASGATSGNVAAVPGAVSSAARSARSGTQGAVHQVVTQAADDIGAVIWSVTWHLALLLAVVYGGLILLRRARSTRR